MTNRRLRLNYYTNSLRISTFIFFVFYCRKRTRSECDPTVPRARKEAEESNGWRLFESAPRTHTKGPADEHVSYRETRQSRICRNRLGRQAGKTAFFDKGDDCSDAIKDLTMARRLASGEGLEKLRGKLGSTVITITPTRTVVAAAPAAIGARDSGDGGSGGMYKCYWTSGLHLFVAVVSVPLWSQTLSDYKGVRRRLFMSYAFVRGHPTTVRLTLLPYGITKPITL
ncbi:uncharacterized protein LOC111261127 [Varroa jacobsoni]|uniref:uncharacterized protein LOC111261127 n=1 Tax=Varroa jacobsoni TaxID=62625 RepID=UPI000BF7EBBB|nr:uncharacterized protein LOC111261127 [Varroa jacobsoni]XP_022690116.1 uncharacterized protein LOC111261127 [Varroa jacobsoni]